MWAAALRAFYGGPVWRAHRDRANATMADSDDAAPTAARPPIGGPAPASLVVATICHRDRALDRSPAWRERVSPRRSTMLDGAPHRLTLAPTARSLLR